MKELIQRNAEEIAIIIYDAPLPPKYFRLTKRFIRSTFVVVPLLLMSLLLLLFLWGLGSRLKDTPSPTLPKVILESENRMSSLETEIESLKATNEALAERLSSAPTTTAAEDPYLLLIKKPYGMQNLIAQNKVTLDQFEFVPDAKTALLKFQIISSNSETKVSGHVLVFMISDAGVSAYPAEANAASLTGIKYSMGEPFAVSRLRPTNALFSQKPSGESVRFLIYIFSREGDLLLIKETETYSIGLKS